jgi:NADH-quinone oxidoreductase subunit K
MNVPNEHLLILASLLFATGVLGFLVRRNVIVVLASVELILSAANLAFLAGTRINTVDGVAPMEGPLFAIFVILVAAAEAAVGLALVIAIYRRKQTVMLDELREVHG